MKKIIFKFWLINFLISIVLYFIYRITIIFETKTIDSNNWFDEILSISNFLLNFYLCLVYLAAILISSLTYFLNFIKRIRKNYFLSFLAFSGIPLFCVIFLIYIIFIGSYPIPNFVMNFVTFSIAYICITVIEFLIFQKKIKNIT